MPKTIISERFLRIEMKILLLKASFVFENLFLQRRDKLATTAKDTAHMGGLLLGLALDRKIKINVGVLAMQPLNMIFFENVKKKLRLDQI